MSDSIALEADFLVTAVILGALLFFTYDCLRIFRRVCIHGVVWMAIEDLIYWSISAVVIFFFIFEKNQGTIRGFAFLGMLLGAMSYGTFVSRIFTRITVKILKRVIFTIKQMGNWLICKNYQRISNFIEKYKKMR